MNFRRHGDFIACTEITLTLLREESDEQDVSTRDEHNGSDTQEHVLAVQRRGRVDKSLRSAVMALEHTKNKPFQDHDDGDRPMLPDDRDGGIKNGESTH